MNSHGRQLLLISSLIGLLAVAPRAADAQIASGTVKPGIGPGFTACLAMVNQTCRLIAPTIAVAVGVENGDAVISYLDPAPGGYVVQKRESITRDLDLQQANGVYDSTQAAYIFSELLSMHDLMYRLPADEFELKRGVGFPPEAVLTPEDQIGVLTSHMQITLGVSAVTADYLINKMGVRVIGQPEEPVSSAPTPEAPKLDAPALAPAPSMAPDFNNPGPESESAAVPVLSPDTDPNLAPEGFQSGLKTQSYL